MAKILGLDLGTNSIGWAVIDENNETPLLKKGVRIFSEGVKIEKGIEYSKTSKRTEYRSARRLKYRRKLRKYETLKILIENKFCPLTRNELELWKNEKKYPKNVAFLNWLRTHEDKNPYFFRNLVSKEKLNLENETERFMLGRAFYHLAQRRGFKSNRLEQKVDDTQEFELFINEIELILKEKENITELILEFENFFTKNEYESKNIKSQINKIKNIIRFWKVSQKIYKQLNVEEEKEKISKIINQKENLGAVKGGIKELSEKIKENNCITLGQYFYLQYKDVKKIRSHYTHREEHYEKEFNIICKKQELEKKIVDNLRKAIFYQRPLRSQKGIVGKCTFEPSKSRCPVSHPLFEIYRMLTFINNIKYKKRNEEKDYCNSECEQLNEGQKNKIIDLFFRKKTQFSFSDIIKKIDKKHELIFNYKQYTSISGCPVNAHLKNIFIDDVEWKNYSYTEKINYWVKIKFPYIREKDHKQSEIDLFDIWHVLFSFEDSEKIKAFAKRRLNLSEKQGIQLLKVPIKQGYASLSLKAIKKIIPLLEQGLIFTHAAFLANMNEIVGNEIWENENLKNYIKQGIIKIINEHKFENKRIYAINSLLKNSFDNNYTYSEEAELIYKKDVEKYLKKEFKNGFWSNFEDKDEFIKNSYNEFINLLKKREFAKIKRIDEKIKIFLSGNNENGEVFCNDENKLEKIYHPSDINTYKKARTALDGNKYLGSPMTSLVKNPVVMKTLHQLKHQINVLIKEGAIDENTKVHIELAKEMNDANMRKAIKKWQGDRENENKEYEKILIELFKEQNKKELPKKQDVEKMRIWADQLENDNKDELLKIKNSDIEKYKLWTEQKGICPYTGDQIPLYKLLDGVSYDIEHTIPRSLSYDNSLENKTIAQSKFNRDIKGAKIPFELLKHNAILQRIEHWKIKYEELEKQIEQTKKVSKAAQTKEAKDKAIQKKHYLIFEKNYWKGKYKRFIMEEVPSGFKNSQLNDTRTITKLALAYLKTVFYKVYAVNGQSTDEFKRIWGLPKKNRGNHVHHAIDAITIACMTKTKNDALAEYYKADETKKQKPFLPKPWKTFTEDVKNIVNDTLIYQYTDDNVIKQSKKKVRKRGKIEPKVIYKKNNSGQYLLDDKKKKIIERYIYEEKNGKKIPIFGKLLIEKEIIGKIEGKDYFKIKTKEGNFKFYEFVRYKKDRNGNKKNNIVYKKAAKYLQGNTFRNAIHEESFYGSINQAVKDNETGKIKHKNGKIITETTKNGEPVITYVVRKKISNLKNSEIDNIVDEKIREIVKKGKKREESLKKEIIELEKKSNKVNEEEKTLLNQKIEELQNEIENKLYIIPPNTSKGKTKYIPINKVRIKAHVSNPNIIKKQRDESKKNKEYKENVYAVTEGNYCIALYQNKKDSEISREVLPYSYLDTAKDISEYYCIEKTTEKRKYKLNLPEIYNGKNFYTLLKKGMFVLFYKEHPDEINWDDKTDLVKRLYKITEISGDGRIKLKFHQNARNDEELKKYYINKNGEEWLKKNKTIISGKSCYQYGNNYPKLRISKGNFKFLINGKDFIFKQDGKIERKGN